MTFMLFFFPSWEDEILPVGIVKKVLKVKKATKKYFVFCGLSTRRDVQLFKRSSVLMWVCMFTQPEFYQVCHTKKDYEEIGPSICRHNPVFGVMS